MNNPGSSLVHTMERTKKSRRPARGDSRRGVGSASQALLDALPDLLAFSPTSSVAIIFSLMAISSVRARTGDR
jgi:hypothetical protein